MPRPVQAGGVVSAVCCVHLTCTDHNVMILSIHMNYCILSVDTVMIRNAKNTTIIVIAGRIIPVFLIDLPGLLDTQ